MKKISNKNKGALLVLVLIFGSIFLTLVVGFMRVILVQVAVQNEKVNYEQAREIAEAGLNYYKWHLAHYPGEVTNNTNLPGPYVMPYEDPELGAIGEFSLQFATTTYCGEVSFIEITSTGHTYENPSIERTVYGRYARPTVAEYAYIINSNVWAGSDRTIVGPYHSNGGIKMDGTNNSTVTSGQSTWTCDSSFGCSPTDYNTPGVAGSGPNSDLWSYPVAPINFTGLTIDLANMQNKAKTGGGVYIGPSSGAGYKIVLKSDGTFDLYLVKKKENEPRGNAWGYQLNKIKTAQFQANYSIPAECPLVYVEDDVWLEGQVSGLVTIAAADVDTVGVDPSMFLNNNITYTNDSAGLLAIAEYDNLIGFDVPNDMEINGIFVAQNGHFGRNYYSTYYLPSSWDQYALRNSLTVNGTIVSNGRVGTKWSCGGTYCSGFNTRYNSYDRNLVNNPPALAPNTSDDYKFIEWREEE